DRPNDFTSLQALAGPHVDAAAVQERRVDALSVIEDHQIPFEAEQRRRGEHDASGRGRNNLCAWGRSDVEAGVRTLRHVAVEALRSEHTADAALGGEDERLPPAVFRADFPAR